MLRALEEMTVVFDLVLIAVVVLLVGFICWLANDLLWDRWTIEEDRGGARQITWLIALNLAAGVLAMVGLALLALRTSVW